MPVQIVRSEIDGDPHDHPQRADGAGQGLGGRERPDDFEVLEPRGKASA